MIFLPDKYDIHTHILPGMDDGSKSSDESLKMIDKLLSQGVNNIIFTPHYYSDRESIESFLERRTESFAKIENRLPEDVNVKLASEVYVSDYLFNREDITPLCIAGNRYILLEFPFFSSFHERSLDQLRAIMYDYKVKPILVHIERYKKLLDSMGAIERLVRLGCLLQVDLAAIGEPSTFRKLTKLFDKNLISLVATDCHNMIKRTPDFTTGVKALNARYGKHYFDRLMENAKTVFDAKE